MATLTEAEKRQIWISLVSAALGGITVAIMLRVFRPVQEVVVLETRREPDPDED